jgi:AraC-like DNA-binding protein
MHAFDFDFRVRRPGGEVGRWVEQVWYARGTVPYKRELIAPTGSTVVLLVLGDPIRETTAAGRTLESDRGLVIGPHTAPVENAPLGETHALGVVTTRVGCLPVTGLRPAVLRGRVVALDVTGGGLPTLRERLACRRDENPEALLDLVVDHLAAHLRSVDRDPSAVVLRTERAVARLEADPRLAIGELARELGVSHAQLDREFSRVVGLPPRALARLLLLRRVLAHLDPWHEISWADLAARHGWADQAHLSRDFKRHTGVSPSRYLEIQRALPRRQDAPGFTPDLSEPR